MPDANISKADSIWVFSNKIEGMKFVSCLVEIFPIFVFGNISIGNGEGKFYVAFIHGKIHFFPEKVRGFPLQMLHKFPAR